MNPLLNKNILVTKEKIATHESLKLLEEAGAKIVFFPTIKIQPIPESKEIKEAIDKFDAFDYLIFTSSNAAKIFNLIHGKHKLDLSGKTIAAVGKNTAATCSALKIHVDLISDEFSAGGLLKTFSRLELAGKKILIPGSSLSRDELSVGLSNLGAETVSLPIYNVVANNTDALKSGLQQIVERKPDIFVFTSPSSFQSFLKIMDIKYAAEYFDRTIICAIGTTTESAIRQNLLPVHIVPETFSLNGVAEAIIKYFHITSHVA